MTTDALIIKGDCLNVMAGMPDGSIDAIVTDPPYGLSFMGKDWDKGVPGESFWREALRVAKPGCHILAAGGSRTYHRLTCAIEDAGWEIRDCIIWMYGSGFPKSLDVSKAIDKSAGAERTDIVGTKLGRSGMAKDGSNQRNGFDAAFGEGEGTPMDCNLYAPATEAAKQWQGWGTALKPAFEPFILARKPLDGTVANNVQQHGCGALNVDGCRIGAGENTTVRHSSSSSSYLTGKIGYVQPKQSPYFTGSDKGRWPANVIHDGSDEVVGVFPETSSGSITENHKRTSTKTKNTFGCRPAPAETTRGDSGSAARFFYCAKASPSEREEGLVGLQDVKAGSYKLRTDAHSDRNGLTTAPRTNNHPTVKPVDLMKYLCRLITPPDGLILDPFCGSGSTGVAAMREGFNFIGIELNQDYAEIARRRIDHERNKTPLFSNVI